MTSIGIDLGTTNSCVAVYRNGRVEIIANDAGFRVTPSCVSFNETERIIGEVAKEEASLNCKNTLFQIKRLIGRKYNDPNVQQDIKMWGFDVVEEGGKPYVQVTYKERMINFSPEQISAMILQQLKDDAEAYMGEKITDAVITVPAYFNDAQRTATRDAGRIAGLNVLSMINEPTAAAIAYGLDSKNNDIRNVLIFDLGGGTFDVTIVTIEDQIFDVKATGGDTHLGGEDITNRMVKYFVEEFQQKHGVDISDSRRALSRLNVACEHAKKKLSVANSAKVQIDGLYMALDFKSNISRAKFEDMNLDLFESTLASVKSVLADANMKKEEIDDIVLVGGSTRIPKIRELLKKFFDGKEMCRIINPDEAVAHGAAALAENIKSGKDRTMKSLQLRDVIPISIGNEIEREQMCIVVARNTTIPTKISKNFYTSEDKQTSIRFSIYEGERVRVHDNHHLGTFVLSGIKSAPAGEAEVEVVFEIDRSGILTVTARDVETGNVKDIKITNEERQMEEIEIKKMIAEAEKFRAEDREWKERIAAKNELEELVFKVKQSVINDEFSIKPDDKRKIMEISNEAANWIKTNNVGKLDASSIRQRREEINEIFNLLREISTG